MQFKVLDLTS